MLQLENLSLSLFNQGLYDLKFVYILSEKFQCIFRSQRPQSKTKRCGWEYKEKACFLCFSLYRVNKNV